jgi:hypothetical protein
MVPMLYDWDEIKSSAISHQQISKPS